MPMTIPFLNFFKKVKDQAVAMKGQAAAARKNVTPHEKPSNERYSKTVMPNATRTLGPADPFEVASRSAATSSPGPGTPQFSSPSRTIAFGAPPPAPRPTDLPPAVALALEPMVERVIAITLADIAAQIPSDYIKPMESIDGARRILVKASEVEKGMASKTPAVSLATVFQQVPEIFLRSIAPGDDTQVNIPFSKVLEQFANLQVRSDQERYQAVPQVETPFLKATLEDNTRFGITTVEPPVEMTGDLPPVRIQLATAEAIAAAEPEIAGGGYGRNGEGMPAIPTRVSLEISPNGTGGSASESVPASSGPSVPTSFVSSPAPTRIPFKLQVPGEDLSSKHEPCSTAERPKTSVGATAAPRKESKEKQDDTGVKINLPLKSILRGLSPSQFSGDANGISDETRIALPFSIVEPQLATGRIAVSPELFAAALPAEFGSLFKAAEAMEVILPLQEVLKNLPADSLRMRGDQLTQDHGPSIATPFSAKADEDAKRFNLTGAVGTEIPVLPATSVTPLAELAAPAPAKMAATPQTQSSDAAPRNPLQVPRQTDEKLDDKAIIVELNNLPGVRACALMFGDGLGLTGSLPPEYGADGLCAMAPSLLQRIDRHMVETKLGDLRSMTLSCSNGTITFFMHENLCLAALHANGELTSEVQEKLAHVVHELSRKYSHPV